jgi:glycosyltransferase involved in cell wall biosynthesis
MNNIISLNDKFSTTKLLTKVEPSFEAQVNDKFNSLSFLPDKGIRKAEGGLRLKGYFKESFTHKPLISIVTIVYNGENHIEETILSVLNQSYDNVEYIIIDGGSTDGTLNIIKKYNDSINYWVSENDNGISDAFNKGIRCCSGQYIGLINADDYYEPDSFECIVEQYNKTSGLSESIIYGETKKITIDGHKQVKSSSKLGWFLSVPFSHCSSFISVSYYKKYGIYNPEFKIGMDVELLMRGLRTASYVELPDFIATQRDGGVSDRYRLDGYKEYRAIATNHFGLPLSYLGYLIKVMVFYKNKVFK